MGPFAGLSSLQQKQQQQREDPVSKKKSRYRVAKSRADITLQPTLQLSAYLQRAVLLKRIANCNVHKHHAVCCLNH
jgi:hypothetical protein